MTANRTAPFFSRLVAASDEPDADLVHRYASARDAAAFESLVRRHGPLVFAICRRTLGREQDAEDAFQAAFLVLAQKAGRIREPQLLSAWLYGVAVRVANKAKSRAARRREEARAEVPEPFANDPAADSDIGPLLDAELAALPEWYRQAVLLCDVQELSRSEAAARLGIPEGTLSSRLAVGRKRLAARLARRGVVLSAPAMASVATAAVPETLIQKTLETATIWAAGGPVANPITELTREGMTMLRKVMMLGCGAATVSILGLGLAGDPAKPPPKPDAKPLVVAGLTEVAKPETVLGPPRQRGILEVSGRSDEIRWSLDGKRISLSGYDQRIPTTQFGTVHSSVQIIDIQETGLRALSTHSIKGYVVGLHPKDSSALIVHLEESGGINVQNKMIVLNFTTGKPIGESELNESAYLAPALSPNGRTVLFTTGDDATGETVVREIDFATGKVERTLFRTKDNLSVVSADGSRVVTTRHITRKAKVEAGGGPATEQEVNHLHDLNVWDTAANRKLWTWMPDEKFDISEVSITLSRDAKTMAIASTTTVKIFDAVLGRELRKYAATEKRGISDAQLSHDGRLTVLQEYPIPQPVPGGAGAGASDAGGSGPPGGLGFAPQPVRKTQFVTVFDNATGRALKKWETQLTLNLAFAPDRPTLAILERPSPAQPAPGMGMGGGGMAGGSGGGQARLGLWEFPTVAK